MFLIPIGMSGFGRMIRPGVTTVRTTRRARWRNPAWPEHCRDLLDTIGGDDPSRPALIETVIWYKGARRYCNSGREPNLCSEPNLIHIYSAIMS